MKTLVFSLILFSGTYSMAQDRVSKNCSPAISPTAIANNIQILDIDNFKGDFKIILSDWNGEEFSLSDAFYDFVSANRLQYDEAYIEMGQSHVLVIAPYSSLDPNGSGPYLNPFEIKK
jgi:hypothetical protein